MASIINILLKCGSEEEVNVKRKVVSCPCSCPSTLVCQDRIQIQQWKCSTCMLVPGPVLKYPWNWELCWDSRMSSSLTTKKKAFGGWGWGVTGGLDFPSLPPSPLLPFFLSSSFLIFFLIFIFCIYFFFFKWEWLHISSQLIFGPVQ